MPANLEQVEQQLYAAYGPFVPGSDARRLRAENAERGLKTCWQCLDGYKPRHERVGQVSHGYGRGKWFCSVACWGAWLRDHPVGGWPGQPARSRAEPPSDAEIHAGMKAALEELRAYIAAHEGVTE